MHKPKLALVLAATILFSAVPLLAQRARVSPHDTISNVLDGNRVTLIYGRPYTKNHRTGEVRKIWGGLVPFGSVWRLGADEATLLVTQKDLDIAGTTVPAGAYTLYMLPEENGTSKLIINKAVGQWGIPYTQQASELARVDLKKETVDKPVDQFTMAIDKNPDGGGILKMTWDTMQFSVPFTVKK